MKSAHTPKPGTAVLQLTWDHVHLDSPDQGATAQWFERMLGAQVTRSTQQGKPRIDLKISGVNTFIVPVARRRRQPAAHNALARA
jgi:hypothetical protein